MRLLAILFAGALAGQAAADAADTPSLGGAHVHVELDAMYAQHRSFETDDSGFFFGLGGYGHVGRQWYVGAEIGNGASVTVFGVDESEVTTYELNVKRAHAFSSDWAGALGAGLSYCRVVYEDTNYWSPSSSLEIEDEGLGGQVFGEFMLTGSRFYLGVKAEYQLTADFADVETAIGSEEGWDYSNLRIGIQIGVFAWR